MIWRQIGIDRENIMGDRAGGVLIQGDVRTVNLDDFRGRVQCVYMDPPFFTGEDFSFRMRIGESGWADGAQTLTLPAYSDKFVRGQAQYLTLLRAALERASELLSPTGALFLHLDSRMNAHARLLCDQVFGENNFINEIIWAYQSGGRAKKHFSRKHDVILFYAKSKSLFFDISRVAVPRKDNRSNHMRRTVDENGRPCRTIRAGGKLYTYYDDEPVFPDDVWTDVSHLQQKDPQRTGYDTQKPLALLNRIVRCCTRPGDIVADLFCGSGTALVAAAENDCRYLGVDMSPHAISVCRKRLLDTTLELRAPFNSVPARLEAELIPGIGYYELTLGDYAVDMTLPEGAFSQPKDLQVAGLDAVDQWSAGFLREGAYKAYVSAARRKQTPVLTSTLELPLLRGQVAVSVVDVLGRRTLWTPEMGQA
ncbi:MAG: site-specific DNA-methyltransferase [Clostridia bacterium]|nr:site-specific DNA-methyltransferase [Clostridia bacterium]